MIKSLFEQGQTAYVNAERVRQARELAGLTQSQLAKKAGITQAMVAHIEGGFKQPSEDVHRAMARALEQTEFFLLRPSPPELQFGVLQYRAKSGVSRKRLQGVYRTAQLVLELALGLSTRVRTIPVKIKPSRGNPEEAAQQTRRAFGLDHESPVSHLVRSFEKAGGIVLALPKSEEVDAFAVWARQLPIIAVTENSEGDRIRLTVAHELGHLVMHQALTSNAETEREAYSFGAELMMPRSALIRDFSAVGVTLAGLSRLKKKWGISMQALARRAKELEVITDRQYHYLMQQLSERGWRLKEPSNLRVIPEKPRLLRRMAELAYGDPIDYAALARDYGLKVTFVADVVRRYAGGSEVISRLSSGKILAFDRK